MSEIETFGFNEDELVESVVIIEESAGDTVDNPVALKALIDDCVKQAAECMDAAAAEKFRAVRKAAEERLAAVTVNSGITEKQWLALAKAYSDMGMEFKKRLALFGGASNESYHALTQELSAVHQKESKPKGKGAPRSKKKEPEVPPQAVQQGGKPGPTPEDRWVHIQEHVKNLGMDAWAIYDELGCKPPLTHGQVSDVLREANGRACPDEEARSRQEEVETLSAGEPNTATTTEPSTSIEKSDAPGVDAVLTQRGSVIWDEQLKKAIEVDTGEVITVAYFLGLLGMPELPTQPDLNIADKILDVMHTRYLDPAARYREQAEKRAAPLEKRAAQMEAFFGPYLDMCGDKSLPRKGDRAKPENRGKFSSKTLDLQSGSISWEKDGGTRLMDSGRFYAWCQRKLEEMQALAARCAEGDDEAKEELKYLQDTYGLKIETKAVASTDKIKELTAASLPDGWEVLPTDEFAKRTIK